MGPYALVDSIGDRFDEMMTTEDILVQPDGGEQRSELARSLPK